MAFVNDRDRIIKNALDLRTIIETAEPQIANQFIKLFVEKLVIKDHTGTIHFKVPSLGEGPYRPQESFRIGEYPDPSPDPFESEKYPFERSMGIDRPGLLTPPYGPRFPRRRGDRPSFRRHWLLPTVVPPQARG